MSSMLFFVAVLNLGIGVIALRNGEPGFALFHTVLGLAAAVMIFQFAGRNGGGK